jgi:predicted nucleic acid-binding protein
MQRPNSEHDSEHGGDGRGSDRRGAESPLRRESPHPAARRQPSTAGTMAPRTGRSPPERFGHPPQTGRPAVPPPRGRSIFPTMITVYLDACCLNRPFDDQTQDRIRLEAEAVLLILAHVHRGEWRWIGSEVLTHEVSRNPDTERRRRVQVLVASAAESIVLDEQIEQRGTELETLGFAAFDALHLACAEHAAVDVFLTTDDGLRRRAGRHQARIRVQVENPLTWLNRSNEP